MLSVTEVPKDRLYKGRAPNNALVALSPRSMKQSIAAQKLIIDLNSEFNENSIQNKRHSMSTQMKSESFLNQTSPKINILIHQGEKSRETASNIDKAINEMGFKATSILKHKASDLELGQDLLHNKASQAINNVKEICDKHIKQTEWVSGLCQTKVAELFSNSTQLKNKSDESTTSANRIFNEVKAKIKVLQPRISNLDIKVQELEAALQQKANQSNAGNRIMDKIARVNKIINRLKNEGNDEIINMHFSKIMDHMSNITTQLEKKFVGNEILQGECEDRIRMENTENANSVERIDQLSKQLHDNETKVGMYIQTYQQQLDEIADKITTVGESLKEEKTKHGRDMRYARWHTMQKGKRSLQHSSKIANVGINKLKDDWTEFSENNRLTQKDANDVLKDLSSRAGASSEEIASRIEAISLKIKWCKKRIATWEYNKLDVSDFDKQDLINAENKLLQLENILTVLDRKDPPCEPYEDDENIFSNEISEPPNQDEGGEETTVEMPDRKLTYTDEELNAPEEEIPPDEFEEEEFNENEEETDFFAFNDYNDNNYDYNDKNNDYEKDEEDENDEEEEKEEPKPAPKPKRSTRSKKGDDNEDKPQPEEQEKTEDDKSKIEPPQGAPKRKRGKKQETSREQPQPQETPQEEPQETPQEEPQEKPQETPQEEPKKKRSRGHESQKGGASEDPQKQDEAPSGEHHKRKRISKEEAEKLPDGQVHKRKHHHHAGQQ